jgi:regulatory protein
VQQQARPTPEPGEITKVESQQHNAERVSIYIAGAFAFGIPAIEAARRGLAPGYALTATEIDELVVLDESARAVDAALQFLSYRPRSEYEVRQRLRRKGYPDAAIEHAVQRLLEWGYLNDRQFADFWLANRLEHSPRGERALMQELRRKGIDVETARDALGEQEVDEQAAALELARKRLPSLRNLDRPTRDRRLMGFLQRRGYGWEVIGPVLKELNAELDDEADA